MFAPHGTFERRRRLGHDTAGSTHVHGMVAPLLLVFGFNLYLEYLRERTGPLLV